MTLVRKKLIEVALPLEAINKAAKEEKSVPRHGHPQTLHYWWARRPLAAARAVIFAQMVDDPSAHPDLFPTEKKQETERQRLFRIIQELVKWENTTNETVLQQARDEIWQSWRATSAENADHPRAKELFDRHRLPTFHDPFAGGGAIPLEAQRLGLESRASDLNPVAVLINKAMIEIPPKFIGRAPVNPETRRDEALFKKDWHGSEGLAEDVRHYGNWMRDEAEKRIGHLYPKIEVTAEIAKERPDLKPLLGRKLTVIGWLWARTAKSPDPAFANVDVPLATTFMLSNKVGKEAYVEPLVESSGYSLRVKVGTPKNVEITTSGTKLASGANFRCIMSGAPIAGNYLMAEGKAGRMGARLMAVVAASDMGRVYLSPTSDMEQLARKAQPVWKPDVEFFQQALGFRVGNYGLSKWSDLFTSRQLATLTTFSDLIEEARERAKRDAVAVGVPEGTPLDAGGTGARAYAEAVSVYLGCALSRLASYNNTICVWNMKGGSVAQIFGRQTISMSWDYIEINPLEKMSGNWSGGIEWVSDVLERFTSSVCCKAIQQDVTSLQNSPSSVVFSTDPPYYDNIGYADLSDFFYVWLRSPLKSVFSDLFATLTAPKAEELVATPARHGGKEAAEAFFLSGMTRAMHRLAEQAHPAFPVTIYYAFKQAETDSEEGTSSTGWETFLDAVVRAGFAITGTWPMRTERDSRLRGQLSNALASSIVLVCRPSAANAPTATRREFLAALKAEIPDALKHLQRGNIAPVDLAQAAIGPGMAVYTRYSKVLDAEGKTLSVREALAIINHTLDEVLAEQEGDFDADSRWALSWFDQFGFAEGAYGVAETLSKAKNNSVSGMVEAGILASKSGKVRLLKPAELAKGWEPDSDQRLTVWEIVHHLLKALEAGGETAAGALATKLGNKAEIARELAYRLYTLCERKKRTQEALAYNTLVQSWPEIMRLARQDSKPHTSQAPLFGQE